MDGGQVVVDEEGDPHGAHPDPVGRVRQQLAHEGRGGSSGNDNAGGNMGACKPRGTGDGQERDRTHGLDAIETRGYLVDRIPAARTTRNGTNSTYLCVPLVDEGLRL